MQDTFVLAVQRLGELREPPRLRAWLFAIARHEAMRRARARSRTVPTEDAGRARPSPSPGPQDVVTAEDTTAVVWEAAGGLSARDRVVLDLHLRQGLEGQDLAGAVGTSRRHAYVLTNRLRKQIEQSVGALLVARLGRSDCDDLGRVLAEWDGRFSPLWRKRVARHVDTCEVCSRTRRVLTSPEAVASAMPNVPAPEALREETLDLIRHATTMELPGEWPLPWARGGFPPGIQREAKGSGRIVAAAIAALLGFGGGFVLGDGIHRGPRPVLGSSVAVTTTTGVATTTTPPPIAPVDTTSPVVTPIVFGTSRVKSGAASSCPQEAATTMVSVTATDDRGVVSVTMSWSGAGASGNLAMGRAGAGYSSVLGPFLTTGAVSVTVRATDAAGNVTAVTGRILAC